MLNTYSQFSPPTSQKKSRYNQSPSPKKELIIEIDNEDDTKGRILIKANTDVFQSAKEYCEEYNLDPKLESAIARTCLEQAEKLSITLYKELLTNLPNSKKISDFNQKNAAAFERLWLDATEGQKQRNLLREFMFEKLYPFQPNQKKSTRVSDKTFERLYQTQIKRTRPSSRLKYEWDDPGIYFYK